jgi:hypothetical protein
MTTNEDLEERYAALRAAAKLIDADVHITLTASGIDPNEIYQIKVVLNPDTGKPSETITDVLDDVERLIADPRLATLAKAAKRMTFVEDGARSLIEALRKRRDEYAIARDALNQAHTTDTTNDEAHDTLAVHMARLSMDDERTDALIDLAKALNDRSPSRIIERAEASIELGKLTAEAEQAKRNE